MSRTRFDPGKDIIKPMRKAELKGIFNTFFLSKHFCGKKYFGLALLDSSISIVLSFATRLLVPQKKKTESFVHAQDVSTARACCSSIHFLLLIPGCKAALFFPAFSDKHEFV